MQYYSMHSLSVRSRASYLSHVASGLLLSQLATIQKRPFSSSLTLNGNRSGYDKSASQQFVYRIMQKLQNKLEQWLGSLSKVAARERCYTLRKSEATAPLFI